MPADPRPSQAAGTRPAGVILAGGQSRRMGGGDKALMPMGGKPLLQHVIDRMAPQVDGLALAVERVSPALADFGLPQLADPRPGHRGPLPGLLVAMRHFAGRSRWLLLAPCDAPFLPGDLADRLLVCATEAAARAACVSCGGELQPTFSLFHCDLLPQLEQAVMVEGQAGFKRFLHAAGAARCEWPAAAASDGAPPFFNVNDPAALEQARAWLREREETAAC
jgi:molybdenum cofactor guanylyltransferase